MFLPGAFIDKNGSSSYDKSITAILARLYGGTSMKPYLIGIAGGTGSGKSTFTNRLKAEFSDHVTVVYHDNYYRAQDEKTLEERKLVNYDHPDALETDMLLRHLRMLREGRPVNSPVYDFTMHTRSKETILIQPSPVIIIEGILVLSSIELRNMLDIKIYVEADADERILRRVSRDIKERGRDLDNIVKQYLSSVKPMHYAYVEPTKSKADIVINSGRNDVAFEVIANQIRTILESNKPCA